MEPLVYIIAIMGCGDDGVACQRERIAPATYSTAAQCQAALPVVLQRTGDLDYPVIQANCEATSQRAAQAQIDRQNRG